MRILVVEDHADAALMLKRLLELDGHEVIVAATGREALAAVDASPPSLVLCDLGLPGDLDGLAVGRAIKTREAPPYLVAMTGYTDANHRRSVWAAGFDLHLAKPVRHEELSQLCRELAGSGTAR